MNGWLATRCRAMLLDAGVRGLLEHEAARGGTCGSGAGEEGGGLPPVSAVLVNFPDQCSCIVANILGAPLLEANGNPWVQAPLAVPQFMAGVTPEDLRTSWRAWLRNARQWALLQLMPYATPRRLWRDLRAELSLAPEDNAPGAPLLSTCRPLEPRVRLLAPELEFPRPLPPGYAVVGAISPRPAEGGTPSDPGLAAFVDGAQGGLVLAGFGSTPVYGRSLGPRDYTEIAAAFASLGDLRLPGRGAGGVRVLWGVRDSALPEGLAPGDLGLGGNTRVVAWYPDNEVLAHPNTLAFVTHCGLHSVYGGAFHGVPLVGLPFTAEQLDNDLKARSRGLAVTCPDAPVFAPRGFDRCGVAEPAGEGRGGRGCAAIRAEVLVGSIKEVLLNGSYAAAARRVGRLMRARYAIRPPLQLAADEIELALLAAGVGGGGGGGLLAGEQPENSAAGPASH
ncbi:MAG: hypothetical protein J3K34DRAFT_416080 [Monoraphidium minutum]|nr:MAG: hypothetical protein J3K34DRAFT_416080 [Monoraphidium minutum]